MFSGRISEMMANQIEKKLAEKNDLNGLTDSELSQLAVEFVGDAPPSHVPRETVLRILSQQPEIEQWRASLRDKVAAAAKEKIVTAASNVDPRMVEMIKQQFAQWLQNSGMNSTELTGMIDANSDGLITKNELNQFIENLSGSQPPDWVSDAVINIIDKDGDGTVELGELWNYLESIGFETPKLEEKPDQNDEIGETEIDELLEELDDQPNVNDLDELVVKESPTEDEIDNSVKGEISDQNTEAEYVATSIEKSIEKLHLTRLHREANDVINNSEIGNCKLFVERLERSLMVMDSYRGGMTITGLLDGGPYTVSVLFEPEYNDSLEECMEKTVQFTGKLYEWSSGLKQAKLKGSNLTY